MITAILVFPIIFALSNSKQRPPIRYSKVSTKEDILKASSFCCKVIGLNDPEDVNEFARDLLTRIGNAALFRAYCLDSQQIVGFCEVLADLNFPNRAILQNLCVANEFRRQRIGKSLVELCEEQSRLWGLDSVILNIEDDNSGAKSFYESLDYITLPDSRAYGSEMMEKSLL